MASNEVLQAFVQAATQGSFSAAARKLGKSQSTVSAAVASLVAGKIQLLQQADTFTAGQWQAALIRQPGTPLHLGHGPHRIGSQP